MQRLGNGVPSACSQGRPPPEPLTLMWYRLTQFSLHSSYVNTQSWGGSGQSPENDPRFCD